MPAAVPRARTDEHTAQEPVRTVIAVRGAVIGPVGVIAILADRRPDYLDRGRVGYHRADADAYRDLRLRWMHQRERRRKEAVDDELPN